MTATAVVGGMRLFSVAQLAVAACRFGNCVVFLRAFFVQVATSRPQATGRLLAVCPDVAEFLAVVTLRQTSLGFVRLYFDCNVTEAC
jgi:hypothetical protein